MANKMQTKQDYQLARILNRACLLLERNLVGRQVRHHRRMYPSMTALKKWEKIVAWDKARPVPGSSDLRLDCDGRTIKWSEYGHMSTFGWEVDHVHPVALGGPNHATNYRARHWLGNRRAGGLLGAWQREQKDVRTVANAILQSHEASRPLNAMMPGQAPIPSGVRNRMLWDWS